MVKRLFESGHHDQAKQKKSKNGEQEVLFYEEEEPNDSFNELSQDEEENLSDIDWEEIPLDGSVTVTVSNIHRDPETIDRRKRTRNSKSFNYQRLKYGLHLIMMPFMLSLLKTRMKWTDDERLKRRLRRSVPKLIGKKFKSWSAKDQKSKNASLRTLLLGLVLWFRSNYKINSNGIRQNFNRLQYLIRYADSQKINPTSESTYRKVFDNQQEFYGNRPMINDDIEDIRKMAKKKIANRDILTLFFLIILHSILPGSKRLYLCFALPLHDYDIRCKRVEWQIQHNIGKVPNKFDSDLIQPYFWIELELPGLSDDELYIIDPIAHLDERKMVLKTRKDDFVPDYQPSMDMKYNLNQRFHYVVNIECTKRIMRDVSPRYVPNVCYRYFELPESCPILKSKHYASYQNFSRWLEIWNRKKIPSHDDALMKQIALSNFTLPKSVTEIKRADNFIIPSILKSNEVLKSHAEPAAMLSNLKEPIFWKKDVIQLKSKQHWAILGRSILPDAQPLKRKKYLPMKERMIRNLDRYIIKELFSYEQTIKTPKYPNTYHDHLGYEHVITDLSHYRNKFGNIEIYSAETKPEGFELIALHQGDNVKGLINHYNRTHKKKHERIQYLEVVSGFDFRHKKGHAIPKIESILVKDSDYVLVESLKRQAKLMSGLSFWDTLLTKLRVNDRLIADYGNIESHNEGSDSH
ncbi:YDR314C [Saccharomyces arboricola H-6]|uniref:YDR314C n=1 Tax=Saccharomyces arboricola (strain H-6 / AS 2.3317 / CBS 10644) TaxID=1160507 RepID=J8Q0U8_SACAR|nr:YDR314C [Saccharomyces arboricola H-6]